METKNENVWGRSAKKIKCGARGRGFTGKCGRGGGGEKYLGGRVGRGFVKKCGQGCLKNVLGKAFRDIPSTIPRKKCGPFPPPPPEDLKWNSPKWLAINQ